MTIPAYGLQELGSDVSAVANSTAGRPGLVKRSGRSQDPAELYDNAVKHRDELPGAQQPRNFALAKKVLLALSALSVLAGFVTLGFGAYVESRRGFKTVGMWDVPTDISTGSIFLGCFTLSVSATLMAITHRNWHPVLLTYMFFIFMIIISNLTIFGMMLPGAGLALLRASAWKSMPPELHLLFFQKFNCCGYDRALVRNQPTCNLAAIGKGPGTLVTPTPLSLPPLAVPPPPAPAAAPSAAEPPSSVTPGEGAQEALRTAAAPASAVRTNAGGNTLRSASPRLLRRQAQPPPTGTTAAAPSGAPAATPTEPPIPQFTNPLPLGTDSKPSGPPSVPTFAPTVPDSGVEFCQKAVEPWLDADLATIRPWFVMAALLGIAQQAVLYVYAKKLSAWKMSRGVARW